METAGCSQAAKTEKAHEAQNLYPTLFRGSGLTGTHHSHLTFFCSRATKHFFPMADSTPFGIGFSLADR